MQFREDDLLRIEVRQQIIAAIVADQNRARKDECYRRYQVYKDNSIPYVIDKLAKQFAEDTVREMSFAISNLSLVRKVIDKLGRVYSYSVKRTVADDKATTKSLEDLTKELKINVALKKANRFLKLQKNVAIFPRPVMVDQMDGSEKYTLKVDVIQPYQFDVVEHCEDPETPIAFIFSNYIAKAPTKYTSGDAATAGRTTASQYQALVQKATRPSVKDTIIADGSQDRMQVSNSILDALKSRERGTPVKLAMPGSDQAEEKDPRKLAAPFVFWTTKYHFTCDWEGNIIMAPDNMKNPIQMLPVESLAMDQDGSFWAQGGQDLIDGAILVNSMITHLNHIGVSQGYGQMWMRGKGVPKTVKVGPQRVVRLEWESTDDPQPEFGYANSNAPLADLKSLIEMYVALLLTTNNLSTSGVATQLQGGQNFASGIALMVDKAESVEDVQDQEAVFQDAEPEIWEIIQAWLDVYGQSGLLIDDLKAAPLKNEFILNLKFGKPETIMTEAEKIQNIKSRQDLPEQINTHVEYIMMDNPGMSEEDAKKKLKQILEEKMKLAADGPKVQNPPNGNDPNQTGGQNGSTQDQQGSQQKDSNQVQDQQKNQNQGQEKVATDGGKA